MAPVTTTGPKYGIELNTPARSPQNAGLLEPDPPQRQPGRDPDDRAGEQLHDEEALDLAIDLVAGSAA